MRWSMGSVVGFARRNGVPAAELVTAAALCWATSQGDDLHQDVAALPDGVTYLGLWGVPMSDRDGFDRHTLLAPNQNASAAATLWAESGPGWTWSPVFTTGLWRFWVDDAARELAAGTVAQAADVFPPEMDLPGRLDRVAASLGTRAEQLTMLGQVARDHQPGKG